MADDAPIILFPKRLRSLLPPFAPVLMASLLAVTLPGCIVVGGTSERETPTTGQQLIDLKRAADEGAISREEYDATRAKLLKGDGTR
jgi:dihydroxyacid dehydratase/phosphogluconate dehydratase